MTLLPPTPTLFPYTTLFRSEGQHLRLHTRRPDPRSAHDGGARPHRAERGRSEEHTSELQSHSDLVCRLLLEKKNRRGRGSRRHSRLAANRAGHSRSRLSSVL